MEQVYGQWLAAGEPELYDYSLTRTESEQWAWCHDAATGPRWPTHAATADRIPLAG
ncbi:hypothetical protein [Streptomyces carminius]|uniref:hypothetical protein n=1 Tax=Streptomyces carminius TaxID=2665496 RepID=UPI001304334B|nr:hypothetical protein [Streptomyces carminius]